jgi:hypothetical protein
MEFLGERFYTSGAVLKVLGGLGKKMFEYIRDTLKLIPSPIRVSSGKGMAAYYPECAVNHLKKVMLARKKGITFSVIKRNFAEATEMVFQRSEYLRRQYELEKRSKVELSKYLMTGDHPYPFIKMSNVNTANLEKIKVDEDVMLALTTNELKKEFKQWDGKSLDGLYRIRHKIDNFEHLAVAKRVKASLKGLSK